jgi:septum formation protein
MKILLASTSLRRYQLISALGHDVIVISPNVCEIKDRKNLTPKELSTKNAKLKAHAPNVLEKSKDQDVIIAADTIVVFNEHIFLKPKDKKDAYKMLSMLSNQSHRVITSYCLIGKTGQEVLRSIESEVSFRKLNYQEIDAYLANEEWMDKAGGYAVQGVGAALIQQVKGSLTNVIGLPIEEVLSDANAVIGK